MRKQQGREVVISKKRCKLCISPDRVYYENLHLVGGESHRSISKRMGNITHVAVSNHFKHHMGIVEKQPPPQQPSTNDVAIIEERVVDTQNEDFDTDYLGMLKRQLKEINEEIESINRNEHIVDVVKRNNILSQLRADRMKTITMMDKVYDEIRKKKGEEENIMTKLEIVVITESESGEYSETELKDYEMDLDIDSGDIVDDELDEDSEES